MLRLAFDFIITWRETRTRPNAYHISKKEGLCERKGAQAYNVLNEGVAVEYRMVCMPTVYITKKGKPTLSVSLFYFEIGVWN